MGVERKGDREGIKKKMGVERIIFGRGRSGERRGGKGKGNGGRKGDGIGGLGG